MKFILVQGPQPLSGEKFPMTVEIDPTATERVLRLGRARECDIVLPDLHVSRHHARLSFDGEKLVLQDLDSKYGTFVNAKRIKPYTKVTLEPDDEVRFGKVVLKLVATESVGASVFSADGGMDDAAEVEAPPLGMFHAIAAAPSPVFSADGGTDTMIEDSELQAAGPVVSAAETEAFLASLDLDEDPQPVAVAAETEPVTDLTDAAAPPTETIPTALPAFVSAEDDDVAGFNSSDTSVQDAEVLPATRPSLAQRYLTADFAWLPWFYLAVITVAEYVTAAINFQFGLLLHSLILVSVLLHGALTPSRATRGLYLSLSVAPLIRLLSLSLPLVDLPQMAWYPCVALPLLLSVYVIMRQAGVSPRSVGLSFGQSNIILQLMIAGGGIGLGLAEYLILRPKPLIDSFTWGALLLPALSLTIFTGFNEEIIFRGLLQSTALPVLRRWALFYVSLLFAVLHVGYLSLNDLIFVFAVGYVFAYIVRWSGSILGVTLAHGLTNIGLFLVVPFIVQNPDAPISHAAPYILVGGVSISLIAVAILAWRGLRRPTTFVAYA